MIRLQLFLGVVRLLKLVMEYLLREQLKGAAQEELYNEIVEGMDVLAENAIAARNGVDESSSGVRDDPWNEDNWGDQAHNGAEKRDRKSGSL